MIKAKTRNSRTIPRTASAQYQLECGDQGQKSIHRIVLIKNGIFVGRQQQGSRPKSGQN
jgi:hypothetical protein